MWVMKYECKIQGGTWGEVEAVSARDAAERVAQRERTPGMIRVVPATGDASSWWSDGEGGLVPMSHYIGDGVYAHADADGTLTLSTSRDGRFDHIVMTRDMLREALDIVNRVAR